jgi:Protein of unknown function (DUF3347)
MRFSMRVLSAAAICVIVTAAASAFQSAESVKAIVGSYLEIQTQLAADKTDGVKAAAATIAAKAGEMGESGAPMVKAAKAVSEATDLKSAREAFGPLSDAVIAAAQAQGSDVTGVKLGFCPMVKRSWLQKDAKVRNPYYGSGMLECGELKELKK